MSTTELDRSMLDGKDREELHAIAGAMGVKGPPACARPTSSTRSSPRRPASRGGNGDAAATRRARAAAPSARRRASRARGRIDRRARRRGRRLAASADDEPEVAPRPVRRVGEPRRRPRPTPATRRRPRTAHRRPTTGDQSGERRSATARRHAVDPDDERASYGDGNRTGARRRRASWRPRRAQGGEPTARWQRAAAATR